MFSIYKITNSINDKIYVGQTSMELGLRFEVHKKPSETGCRKLHNALNKHGRENFKIENITEAYSQLEANVLEVHFIAKFGCIRNGYNIREGGSRGKNSPETLVRMSLAHKGRRKTPQHCAKMSEARRGRKLSSKTCEKMKLSHTGLKHSAEQSISISRALKGRRFSVQHRAHMKDSQVARRAKEKAEKEF